MLLLRPRHLAFLLAAPAVPALAQAGPEPVGRVEVTAAGSDPRRDDTASRIVIRREEIARHGDASVLDVFKRIPGVTVTGGAGRSTEGRMRGLGAGCTQVLVNGERMPAGFDIDSLSPDLVERIEVLRSATAELSAQSVAGTINIVLRKGEREARLAYPVGRGERSSWSVSASGNEERFERTALGFEENTRPDGQADRCGLECQRRAARRARRDPPAAPWPAA